MKKYLIGAVVGASLLLGATAYAHPRYMGSRLFITSTDGAVGYGPSLTLTRILDYTDNTVCYAGSAGGVSCIQVSSSTMAAY